MSYELRTPLTGIGISPDSQGRLFQPFTQLDSRLSRHNEGTGLGLALVKNLAEMHGGRVAVESKGLPGRGSRFTIVLPWQAAHQPRQRKPACCPCTRGPYHQPG